MSTATGNLNETKFALRLVIQSLIDGQEGFKTLGEDLKDETLRHYFLTESLKRASFRGELETILHQEGLHDVKESGTISGMILRTWGDLKSTLGAGDHSLLATAEEGEDAAKSAYEDALSTELPFPVRQLLITQSTHVQQVHDFIKTARDIRR